MKNTQLNKNTSSNRDSFDPVESTAWTQLADHYKTIAPIHMRELFAQDPRRFEKFSIRFGDLLLDYSKNRVTEKTMSLLCNLAEEADLPRWIDKLFAGEEINHTEKRAVLHTALRNRSGEKVLVNGKDVMPEIHEQLRRLRGFSEAVRTRVWRGYTGQPITDVVNIGVGGSDLGPLMACEALKPYAIHDLHMHFVSNVDESHIIDTLEHLKPETTLFIIASKSFTTADTLINAETSREWFLAAAGQTSCMAQHFVAVTANPHEAQKYGIEAENTFEIWDWVGGRYSMWSAMGLSIAISVGMDNFESMLEGAYAMDEHFRKTPMLKNLPVILGLLGIWYNNFFETEAYAVLPYDQHLHRFPPYLRQMDMESNGKRIDREGRTVQYQTGPIIFGQLGITGQHAFYQLMHQGTKLIPADFLAPIYSFQSIVEHHRNLMSNVFAQTEALMIGRTEDEARKEMASAGMSSEEIDHLLPYRVFPGNKPTNTILFDELTPYTLGMLVAMYEHKVFVQGVVWNINSFDQWGVELGKHLAKTILPELENGSKPGSHDSSTTGLVNYYNSRINVRE
ncbi:MAG: glucose-6-phosphate isomerase [Acidiferrobacterales bacterium]